MRAVQCDRCLRWIEASCTFCRYCRHSWLEQIPRTKEDMDIGRKKRLREKELNMEGTQEKYEFEYCNLLKAHELGAKSHIKTAYKMLTDIRNLQTEVKRLRDFIEKASNEDEPGCWAMLQAEAGLPQQEPPPPHKEK